MKPFQISFPLTDTYLNYGIISVGKKKAETLGLPTSGVAIASVKINVQFDRGKKRHALVYDPYYKRFFGVKGWLVENNARVGDAIVIETVTPGKLYRFCFAPQSESAKPKPTMATIDKPLAKSVVGEPINYRGLVYGPVNEQGVVLLFGMLFDELGMIVEEVKTGFPDAIIRRFNGKGWARERVEFEYTSKNFLRHKHPAAECDIIICWRHDWAECPLEVIDLASFIPLVSTPQNRGKVHAKAQN